MTKLADGQIAEFKETGFVVVEGVIPHTVIDAVARELDGEIDKRANTLYEHGEISSRYENEGFETRLARVSQETDKLALSISNHVLNGPEVIASSVYRLRPKIPNYGYGAVPWHQDSAYFEPFCDAHLILTFWVPLVDATDENGCLWCITGSHNAGVVKHHADKSGKYLQIAREAFPHTGRRVACPVRRGGVLIMTNRTAHASLQNRTDRVRWSMDLRYRSAELPTNARITRLPDEAVEAQDAGVPAACYPQRLTFWCAAKRAASGQMSAARPLKCIFFTPAAEFSMIPDLGCDGNLTVGLHAARRNI